MATMADIAKSCGVSRTTVSFVLNGLEKDVGIAPQTCEYVLRTAKAMNYCRNELARAVVTGKSRIVGMMYPEVPSEFTHRAISGMLDAASRREYSVKLFPLAEQGREMTLRRLQEQKVAGVLLHNKSCALAEPWLREFQKLDLPCGVFNLPNSTGIGFGVHSDDVAGMEAAVAHLAGLGHRRIAYLMRAYSRDNEYSRARLQGYFSGMEKFAHAPPRVVEIEGCGPVRDGPQYPALLDESPAARPTACVCATDFLAVQLLRTAYHKRLWVPEALSIVGYGGLAIGTAQPMSLTTLAQPFEKMGARAMDLLLDAITDGDARNGRNEALPVELLAGETCRAAAS